MFHRLGYQIERVDKDSRFWDRQQLLEDCGVTTAIDVGANEGQFAGLLRRDGFQGRIISFEPLPGAFDALATHAADDPLWEPYQFALADQVKGGTIHVAANSQSSSLLPMMIAHSVAVPESKYVAEIDVNISTLDEQAKTLLMPSEVTYLKLDVQGYEDKVLKGAQRTLEQVAAIETELSFVPLYAGQRLFHDLCSMLYVFGFHLVFVKEVFRDPRTGHVLQVDGFFRRD